MSKSKTTDQLSEAGASASRANSGLKTLDIDQRFIDDLITRIEKQSRNESFGHEIYDKNATGSIEPAAHSFPMYVIE
jgi:hypothetical protein